MKLSQSFIAQSLILLATLAFWTWTAHQVFSQPSSDPYLRDIRRVERQVDQLQDGTTRTRLELENRITKLETYTASLQAQNDKFQSVGIGAALTLFGLFAGTAWRVIVNERKRKQDQGE